MGAKKILLLIDSDRYSFPLLRFLSDNAKLYGWKIKVATAFDPRAAENLRKEPFAANIDFVDLKKFPDCEQVIRKSDLVIGQVQDTLLLQIADCCIDHRKPLISPARLNRQMALKKTLAKEKNVLILMDCGFSPGLDHIIAKKAIDNIHTRTGKIASFKTYSGTFISEFAEPNPWNFKLTEPVADLLTWGKHNNRHLANGQMQHIPYHQLFERGESIAIRDLGDLVALPEGDSLYYRKIYDLVDAHTVIKGKIVRGGFDRTWNILVKLGLTDSNSRIDLLGEGSFGGLVGSLLPSSVPGTIEEKLQRHTGADMDDIEKLRWLGLLDTTPWNDGGRELSPASVLQSLLEKRFIIAPDDRDSVVMEHHLEYEFRDDHFEMIATLVLHGENARESALAKVVGYACGAAAKSVLLGSIGVKGLHIPVLREIYDPILNELEELGIAFHITDGKTQTADLAVPAENR